MTNCGNKPASSVTGMRQDICHAEIIFVVYDVSLITAPISQTHDITRRVVYRHRTNTHARTHMHKQRQTFASTPIHKCKIHTRACASTHRQELGKYQHSDILIHKHTHRKTRTHTQSQTHTYKHKYTRSVHFSKTSFWACCNERGADCLQVMLS